MHDAPSSLATAADHMLRAKGEPGLQEWIAGRRRDGASYRTISADLEALTDGAVIASHQTIVRWVEHYGAAGAA